ncbi:bacillithiol system redox-active protein YtxJ [Mariniflexile ostreae]|uniref:Bacillithiol system redox-active protein YtxJ n=1 Tax=Mariniflexile ostreae TaxID=1520892 RepID=A0ABV5FBT8_9FLAO
MSFFKKIFTGSTEQKEEKVTPWIALTEITQLEDIKEKSNTKPQIIFKHSTRCGISRMVMNQFVGYYNFTEEELDLYYLDLLNYRDISNEIASKFQILHESPQLLVIKSGTVVAYASHGQINEIDLSQYV